MKNQENNFVIPQGGTYHFVNLDEIISLKAEGSYVTFYLKEGKKLLSSKNLGHFKSLQDAGFFSSHKSHMINLAHLISYNKEGVLTMVDGSQIPVSRRRKDAFLTEVVERFQPNLRQMGVIKRMDVLKGGDREGVGS